jgi:hypothetical protein
MILHAEGVQEPLAPLRGGKMVARAPGGLTLRSDHLVESTLISLSA